MADITTDQQFAGVTLAITDARGRPAVVHGAPVWATSDATVLAVTAGADGMTATVDSVGSGTAHIAVTADADMGDGVVEITGISEDINVTPGVAGAAAVVTLTLGTASDKPAP